MEIITTEKGKPCLLNDGYSYRQRRVNADGSVTWSCLKEKSKKCKGNLISKDNEILKIRDHECVPNEANQEVKKAICNAKKRAREDLTPVPKIYKDELDMKLLQISQTLHL